MLFVLNDDILTIENRDKKQNAGSINYYEREIQFNEKWEGLTIYAIITKEGSTKGTERAVINNKLYIDQEFNGIYTIGFVGYTIEEGKKNYQISTNLRKIPFGEGAGEIETEKHELPTPSEWEIYLNQIQEKIGAIGEKYYVDGVGKGEIFNDYENNIASNVYSHAEGKGTVASGENSHAQNRRAKATGKHSHAQNYDTLAQGESSTAMGVQTKAYNKASISQGNMSEAGDPLKPVDEFNPAHAEGEQTKAVGYASHSEGIGSKVYDKASHAEGAGTIAGRKPKNTGDGSEGSGSEGDDAEGGIPEGIDGIWASHAEGIESKAIGRASHSEGTKTQAFSDSAHSEGTNTLAYGESSHTEGGWTQTGELDETGEHRGNTGNYAHAEGFDTRAVGEYSHTEGKGTVAKGECQHVQGRYNSIDNNNMFAHIVGNGTDSTKRSNAYILDWSGNAWFSGYVRVDNGKLLATENYVQKLVGDIENILNEVI